jgi:hypothetical protein
VTSTTKQPPAQYVAAKIVSEEMTTDVDMFKTLKIKTPSLEEGYSMESHNAKEEELSELPSATSSQEPSKS